MAQDGGAENAGSGTSRLPPYISFQTLLTLLTELKTNGMPPQIDGSVLKRFSGGVQGQLKMAIRALGLVEGDKPTPRMAELVKAHETADFEPLLYEILKETYPYVFALDLGTATPTMFADTFREAGVKGDDVSRKCRTFFLHAAKRAGVPIGPRIATGSIPRLSNGSATERKAKAAKPSGNDGAAQDQEGDEGRRGNPDKMTNHKLEYHLIDLMRKDGIEHAERDAIWTLVQYLTKRPNETTGTGQ